MTYQKTIIPLLILLILGLSLSGCESKQQTGSLIGSGAGALVGAQFGSGSGQVAMAAVGAIAGALIGGKVGQSMDKKDQEKSQAALENNKTDQSSTWTNPDTKDSYTFAPTATYTNGQGQACRTYTMTVKDADGKTETTKGNACRQSDGTWKTVNAS